MLGETLRRFYIHVRMDSTKQKELFSNKKKKKWHEQMHRKIQWDISFGIRR